MRWIMYGDGWERTSEDSDPAGVPAFGCLVVAQEDAAHGRVLLSGRTYFVWSARWGEWDCRDMTGLIDALAFDPGCVVRFGRGIPDTVWREVMRHASEDPRLPKKSATGDRESPGNERVD